MPRLSVWFLRASMLYLAAGFTFGALMLANKAIPFLPWLWRLRPIHVEILLVGWIAQFAMGVAFWMLPRFHSSRGDVRPAWAAFFLLAPELAGVGGAAWPAAGSGRSRGICLPRLATRQTIWGMIGQDETTDAS